MRSGAAFSESLATVTRFNYMKFTAPSYIILSKKLNGKKYHINLNQYRNWHFQVNNNLKTKYCELMYDQLSGIKFKSPIRLIFTMIRGDNRKIDRSNVLCIHEKFFCDALVYYNCIKDDNDNFIQETIYRTGKIDKNNPRIEIEVIEI
jgi:hypothetical protein